MKLRLGANPVVVKELRGRMRGLRAMSMLTIYLVVISGTMFLLYMSEANAIRNSPMAADVSQVGKLLFAGVVIFQTIMVSLLTPAFTSGAITGEKEQKTYDLLVTTLLKPRSIVFGKLGSALAYVVLLIIATAPLESMAFMFGGVSPEEIVLSQLVMLAAALLFASIGLFWSSVVRTSVASNVLTYGTHLFLMIGIPFIYVIMTTTVFPSLYFTGSSSSSLLAEPWFIYFSGIVLSAHPIIAMGISEALLLRGDPLFVYTTSDLLPGHSLLIVSPWLVFCIEAVLVSALLIWLSARAVAPVRYRRRPRP